MNRIVLAVSLLFCFAAWGQTSKAKTLNSEGFDLYKAQKYGEAIAKFQAATQADPKYAMGWYNLAATLSLMRKQNRTCEFDAYRKTITAALFRSVSLDRGRLKRMKADADLDPIRDTVAYQLLLGANPAMKAGLGKLLPATSWWAPATGAFGSPSGLQFAADGTATYWEQEMAPDADAPTKKTYAAKWRVEDSKSKGGSPVIVIDLPARGDVPASQLRGVLHVSAPGQPSRLVFENKYELIDEPSECEA